MHRELRSSVIGQDYIFRAEANIGVINREHWFLGNFVARHRHVQSRTFESRKCADHSPEFDNLVWGSLLVGSKLLTDVLEFEHHIGCCGLEVTVKSSVLAAKRSDFSGQCILHPFRFRFVSLITRTVERKRQPHPEAKKRADREDPEDAVIVLELDGSYHDAVDRQSGAKQRLARE